MYLDRPVRSDSRSSLSGSVVVSEVNLFDYYRLARPARQRTRGLYSCCFSYSTAELPMRRYGTEAFPLEHVEDELEQGGCRSALHNGCSAHEATPLSDWSSRH